MASPFIHDTPAQRLVFGPGTLATVVEEAARLGIRRALVVATPGSGARLGAAVVVQLGARAAGLHAEAVMHVPRAVAEAGHAAAKAAGADGLIAVGGGSALGLAKAIARDTLLPTIAVPTTFSGSEATSIVSVSEAERKITARDVAVLPRTVIYDPDLLHGLPAHVTAASAMNAIAHSVESLWAPERTAVTLAYAMESLRAFIRHLPAAVAGDSDARGECLVASWLAGASLAAGTGLHHKLAHVLGAYGLPHAETHAIILPHVARFNLAAAPEARARLAEAFGVADPAEALASLVAGLPIPQRLRDIGFDIAKLDDAAGQVEAVGLREPRTVSAAEARTLIDAAY